MPIIICLILFLTFVCRQETKEKEVITLQGYFSGADSLQLFYQFQEQGADTLIMIHGGPGMDAAYMIADFEPLSRNHDLLYYDQHGGGKSALPGTAIAISSLHIDRHVADLEPLRKYFSLSKFNLPGHSFGSIIAGKYAVAIPERVNSMILIGAVPPYAVNFAADTIKV